MRVRPLRHGLDVVVQPVERAILDLNPSPDQRGGIQERDFELVDGRGVFGFSRRLPLRRLPSWNGLYRLAPGPAGNEFLLIDTQQIRNLSENRLKPHLVWKSRLVCGVSRDGVQVIQLGAGEVERSRFGRLNLDPFP